jgi:hypothetical protein
MQPTIRANRPNLASAGSPQPDRVDKGPCIPAAPSALTIDGPAAEKDYNSAGERSRGKFRKEICCIYWKSIANRGRQDRFLSVWIAWAT